MCYRSHRPTEQYLPCPDIRGLSGMTGTALMNLTDIGHAGKSAAYQRLLAQRDSSGVWVEYYERDGQPRTLLPCPHRETGMSIDAMMRYWLS